jgi:NADH dehydrogenase [ubiquinone] 1 alpha subcomplex assembly factor 7
VNELLEHLKRRIAREGAIDIAEYMAECLGHPLYGYYRRGNPVGRTGDFTTAPEISQMFGELIGLWCVETWMRMGSPAPFVLAEFGPGRGTLMADALRAARVRTPFLAAMRLHLVETNEPLRAAQNEALHAFNPVWHETSSTVPPGPIIAIGNEFLDALPVRQFERTAQGWRERGIVWNEARAKLDIITLARAPEPDIEPYLPTGAPGGAIAEASDRALAFVSELGNRLAREGGAALLIDYGYALQPGAPREWTGSFQAVTRHGYADPVMSPGLHDLTAHVDFGALARAARATGAIVHGPTTQGAFLAALGIHARADSLMQRADARGRTGIAVALHRLIAGSAMGHLFKAMAIAHPGLGAMPEFAAPAHEGPLMDEPDGD